MIMVIIIIIIIIIVIIIIKMIITTKMISATDNLKHILILMNITTLKIITVWYEKWQYFEIIRSSYIYVFFIVYLVKKFFLTRCLRAEVLWFF